MKNPYNSSSAPKGRRDPMKISIPAFGGINTKHIREIGQFSEGKNFWTKGGSLLTREGTSLVSGAEFTSAIKSIHTATKAGATAHILVEEGANLWLSDDLMVSWSKIKSDCTEDKTYKSSLWGTPFGDYYLLLGNGTQMITYALDDSSVTDLVNEDGDVPNIEDWVEFKGFVFAWGPNYADSNLIRFCGYDDNESVSIDYWPADFAINPSGDPGEAVLAAHKIAEELFVLTNKGSDHIYGNSEDNFEPSRAGFIGLYAEGCSANVGDMVIWLDENKQVSAYSGTTAVTISQAIDDLLEDETYGGVFAKGMGNRFWLFFPDFTNSLTNCYVFDIKEKEWYMQVIPAVITCATLFGDYLAEEEVYFGLSDGRMLKLDDTVSTDLGADIEFDATLGPINVESRKMRLKYFYLTAIPSSDFSISLYDTSDSNEERGPHDLDYTSGSQATQSVRLTSPKGQNISFRLYSTDKVNRLLFGELTAKPGRLK